MERLWAPWRSKYIYSRKRKKCIFCIPKSPDKKNDKKNYVINRSKHSFAILNIYPYNNGHVMVAPFRHVKSPDLLKDDELLDMMKLVNLTKRILDKKLKPAGYNIGGNIGKIGGAGFDGHFHVHIVPRWLGDTNFITPVTGIRVISESLEVLYGLLKREQ